MIKYAFEGFNCTILAYGQTSSGKTHTILGDQDDNGMIPRVISEIYHFAEKQEPEVWIEVDCSYFEIYNEQVNDLLWEPNDDSRFDLPVRWSFQS